MAGKGWEMLMAVWLPRGISLPAAVHRCRAFPPYECAGAYATVRKQFWHAGRAFRGHWRTTRPHRRLGYLFEAARKYTVGAIDGGCKHPS